MLQVANLHKSFDGFMAVYGAHLHVAPGDVVAVIGPNGAGKTTLFNLIAGQLRPDRGSIRFKGREIAGLPSYRICHLGLGRSFQVVNLFHRMTVFENVQVAVLSRQRRLRNVLTPARRLAVERTAEILDSVGLADKADRVCGLLSHGDQKVLEMALALGTDPELLILDEPTAGMSPEETAGAIQLIRKLSRELGITILFCEHDMELVFSVANRIMVLQSGESIFEGAPEEAKRDRRVREAYLGEGD